MSVTCLTQLTRLELGDSFILDQQFELKLDCGMRGPEAMLMRMRAAQLKFGIELECEDEIVDELDMPSDEELAEAIGDEAYAAVRRERFAGFLETLPKVSASFGEPQLDFKLTILWPIFQNDLSNCKRILLPCLRACLHRDFL